MLEVRNVTAAYGAVAALTDVTLRVEAGSITTIIGANGAGKSTCLKAISGLVRISRGSILFEGQPIEAMRAEDRIGLGIAHVMEGRRLFTDQSVADNLELGAYVRRARGATTAEVERDRDLMFERFPILAARRDQIAGTMSGGEQQMLAIAGALMSRPRLVLLDEPSLGLAPKIVEAVAQLIRSLRDEGLTILLVEQQASMALSLADTAYAFERGRVGASGPAQGFVSDDRIRQTYFGSDAPA
jgi:branched-chain amino acid transport system ATP-binding protein